MGAEEEGQEATNSMPFRSLRRTRLRYSSLFFFPHLTALRFFTRAAGVEGGSTDEIERERRYPSARGEPLPLSTFSRCSARISHRRAAYGPVSGSTMRAISRRAYHYQFHTADFLLSFPLSLSLSLSSAPPRIHVQGKPSRVYSTRACRMNNRS